MLLRLAFATVAAIALVVPTVSCATERDGQRIGEQNYQRRGTDQDWDRSMEEREGHYGRGDPDEPGTELYDNDQDRSGTDDR